MQALLARLELLDRRVIFLFVAASVILPLLFPIGFPIIVSPQVKDFHQAIESIPDGSTVLVPMDYDPGALPELDPMSMAVLRHLFSKRPDGRERGLKLVVFSLWPAGPPLATRALAAVADREFHKKYGEDYINLGFKEGREIVMANMGTNFPQVWPTDINGNPTSSFAITRNLKTYRDVAFMVAVSAGYPGIKEWVQQVVSIFNVKMVGGTTGVSAPEYYPYYQSRQLLGLLEGLKGAAEYEKLVGVKGTATAGMDAQSTGHWMIAAFIVLGNVIYFATRKGGR